jgi:hypothetical protein
MGRAHGDCHAGFADGHVAEPMDHDAFYHGPALAGLGFQLGKSPPSHFLVRFIVECDSLPAVGQLTGCAEEEYDGAGLWVAGGSDDFGGVDWLAGELDHGLGCWVSGIGCQVSGVGYWVVGVKDLGCAGRASLRFAAKR